MTDSNKNPNAAGYEKITPTNPGDEGTKFNGSWPADGFILGGTSTADARAGRGQFVQGANGRGNHGWKGGK